MSSSENKNRTCAIIPFYNERNTLNEVVKRTLPYVDHIFLIDDGSTDGYLLDDCSAYSITLLKHDKNLGKGAALRTGFSEAERQSYKIIITLDADLQHEPEKIPDFVNALNKTDVVIGSRMRDTGRMPVQRIMSNKITSTLVFLKTGKQVYDSQSGFRGYRGEIIKNFYNISDNWGAETEILIITARIGAKFGEVTIPTIYNDLSTSKMQPVRAIFQFIRAIFKRYSN